MKTVNLLPAQSFGVKDAMWILLPDDLEEHGRIFLVGHVISEPTEREVMRYMISVRTEREVKGYVISEPTEGEAER